jgi:hypothetical protein
MKRIRIKFSGEIDGGRIRVNKLVSQDTAIRISMLVVEDKSRRSTRKRTPRKP